MCNAADCWGGCVELDPEEDNKFGNGGKHLDTTHGVKLRAWSGYCCPPRRGQHLIGASRGDAVGLNRLSFCLVAINHSAAFVVVPQGVLALELKSGGRRLLSANLHARNRGLGIRVAAIVGQTGTELGSKKCHARQTSRGVALNSSNYRPMLSRVRGNLK